MNPSSGEPEVTPMRPVVGATLDPGDVVGRDDLIISMLKSLRDGNNLLITDPRRVGKTATLTRLVNEPRVEGDRLLSVMIDYEAAFTVEDVLIRTVKALASHDKLWRRVKKATTTLVDVTAGAGPISVRVKAAHADRPRYAILDDLLASINETLDQGDELLVIVMDEVPLAIRQIAEGTDGPSGAQEVLNLLRTARIEHRSLRWIVTGSVGFHHTLSEVATEGAVNDLRSVTIGPLDPDAGRLLVRRLAKGIAVDIESEAADRIVDELNGFPYLLQAVMGMLQDRPAAERGPLGSGDAARLVTEYLDSPDYPQWKNHTVQRIARYYGDDTRLATELLDQALGGPIPLTALAPQDAPPDQRDRILRVVELLTRDHYLERNSGTLRWRYHIIARLWAQHRTLTFDREQLFP